MFQKAVVIRCETSSKLAWSRLFSGKTQDRSAVHGLRQQPTHTLDDREKIEEEIEKASKEQGKKRKEVEQKVDSQLKDSENVVSESPESLTSSSYTMLQVLRSVIVGGALIHKNREGSKNEGRRIRPTIGDFKGNCASNQSPFNNGRIEEWEKEKKEDRLRPWVAGALAVGYGLAVGWVYGCVGGSLKLKN
ncbi:hypothetical protein Tco_0108926 [Tanacetum coccineum]